MYKRQAFDNSITLLRFSGLPPLCRSIVFDNPITLWHALGLPPFLATLLFLTTVSHFWCVLVLFLFVEVLFLTTLSHFGRFWNSERWLTGPHPFPLCILCTAIEKLPHTFLVGPERGGYNHHPLSVPYNRALHAILRGCSRWDRNTA